MVRLHSFFLINGLDLSLSVFFKLNNKNWIVCFINRLSLLAVDSITNLIRFNHLITFYAIYLNQL